MAKLQVSLFFVIISTLTWAGPIIPMNKAFNSLLELIPFLADEAKFVEKKNDATILKNMEQLEGAFKTAKHVDLLKQDIFAPSLEIIQKEIKLSKDSFKKGKKQFAWWRMKSITSQCMACHSRLPTSHTSSFQDGSRLINKEKFDGPYNLGLAQLIVRQYPQAKESFTRAIDESFVKKSFADIMLPFKQLLLIETKISKNPEEMLRIINHYIEKQGLSLSDKELLKSWTNQLKNWVTKSKTASLSNEAKATSFMNKIMKPLFNKNLYLGNNDVELLMGSGLLSNYLYENPNAKNAPEALFWVGVAEKNLERENFFGSGELFLRDCVQHYPKHPIAKECFKEYKESVEFNYTGSRGTDLPDDVEIELDLLEQLITP